MGTSIPGTRSRPPRGFTLIELAVVLFVLGLVLWLAAPRFSALTGKSRGDRFREFAAGSEEAFDLSLFGKQEVRLVLDPAAGTWRFRVPDAPGSPPPPSPFGEGVAVSGIRIEGEDRPPDLVTEILYRPGGRVPETRIFLSERGVGEKTAEWTLRIRPADGSVEILDGRVLESE